MWSMSNHNDSYNANMGDIIVHRWTTILDKAIALKDSNPDLYDHVSRQTLKNIDGSGFDNFFDVLDEELNVLLN